MVREAHTFYSLMALLKCSDKYAEYLISSTAVSGKLKYDLKLLRNFISRLTHTCNVSLQGADGEVWQKEWSERDYELYASVFFTLNDMNEEQRSAVEALIEGVRKGELTCEYSQNTK